MAAHNLGECDRCFSCNTSTRLPGLCLVSQSLAPSSPTQIQPLFFPHWNNHQVLKIEALLAGEAFIQVLPPIIVLPGRLALLSQIPIKVSRE